MSKFHDEMRERFHAATAKKAEILAKSAPLRARYDKVRAELVEAEAKKLAPIKAELEEAEAELFDIDQEIGGCVRALRGPDGMAATGDPA